MTTRREKPRIRDPPNWIPLLTMKDVERLALTPFAHPILLKYPRSNIYDTSTDHLRLSLKSIEAGVFGELSEGSIGGAENLLTDDAPRIAGYVLGGRLTLSDQRHTWDYIAVQLYGQPNHNNSIKL